MALAAAPLAVGAWPARLAARDEVRVPFLQYPLGGGWEGFIIFDRFVAQNHEWLRPVQQETGGYVHNLKVMATDKNLQKTATFGSSTGAIYLAENAYKPFFPEPLPCDDFLHLFGEYMLGQVWLVTFDENIKKVEDLKGQPIGVGLKTQTHWGGLLSFVLDKAYGMTYDNAPLQSLGPVKALDALFDGKVKAAMLSCNVNVPPVTKIQVGPTVTRIAASGRSYHMLEWPPDIINKLVKDTGVPLYSVELPPNTLPNQPEPFNIFADIGTRSVHKDFPEELAYELTKAFIEIGPKAGAMSTIGQLWTPQTMVSPFAFDWTYKDNIHPGAKKAFVEADMWPPEKIWKPVAVGE
ncbi:MAG: TAXI family TRAP transporter solute-binding subunit [Kiloniellales bacterium]